MKVGAVLRYVNFVKMVVHGKARQLKKKCMKVDAHMNYGMTVFVVISLIVVVANCALERGIVVYVNVLIFFVYHY